MFVGISFDRHNHVIHMCLEARSTPLEYYRIDTHGAEVLESIFTIITEYHSIS